MSGRPLSAAPLPAAPVAAEDAPSVAAIRPEPAQVAFLVSGDPGGGTPTFEGQDHGFRPGGVGLRTGPASAAGIPAGRPVAWSGLREGFQR